MVEPKPIGLSLPVILSFEQRARALPWQLLENSAGVDHSHTAPSFAHTLYWHGESSDYFGQFVPILNSVEDLTQLARTSLVRARIGLYLPSPHYPTNPRHVDTNEPHTVVLYYMNETDGDTVLYTEPETRITPKRGHYIQFDGSTPHSSSNPTHHPRLTLNLNYAKP